MVVHETMCNLGSKYNRVELCFDPVADVEYRSKLQRRGRVVNECDSAMHPLCKWPINQLVAVLKRPEGCASPVRAMRRSSEVETGSLIY